MLIPHRGIHISVGTFMLLVSYCQPITVAAQTVVSPSRFADTEGGEIFNPGDAYPDNNFPDLPNGFRVQQLYSKADFDSLGPGPYVIGSMAFRPDASVNAPVSAEYVYTMNLSTTPSESLGPDLAGNYGPNGVTTVLQDAIVQYNTDGVPREGGLPHDFDYAFAFETPFTFDPAEGNLLVEWISPTNPRLAPVWQDGTLRSSSGAIGLSSGEYLASFQTS